MKKFLRTLTIAAVAAAASVVPPLISAPTARADYSGAVGDMTGDGKADVIAVVSPTRWSKTTPRSGGRPVPLERHPVVHGPGQDHR